MEAIKDKNKTISALHFITDKSEDIASACRGGAKWIQLRVKDRDDQLVKAMALKALEITTRFGAKLIINDYVELAKEVHADGVHLGKTDMDPAEARNILGEEFIIGGTANTFEDIQKLAEGKVDYIGLGPFRFTTTKKNLSPILGLEGYKTILEKMKSAEMFVPVVAIGGIVEGDLEELFSTGIHGIAISSAISSQPDQTAATQRFLNQIKRFADA